MDSVLKSSDFEYDGKGALLSCCVVGGVGSLDEFCGGGTSPTHGVRVCCSQRSLLQDGGAIDRPRMIFESLPKNRVNQD